MNHIRLISSLHKDENVILKMAIGREHLSAFLKYLEDFKGGFFKVKLNDLSCVFYEEEENGETRYLKIKVMRYIRDACSSIKYDLKSLKDFVEHCGTLEMSGEDMKALEKIGIHVSKVD